MSVQIQIPGKTFFAGEYLALKGHGALVFLSSPKFTLKVSQGEFALIGIHPESPAGLLALENKELLKNFRIEFIDAYQGKGGFGASTAQYLAVYCLLNPQVTIEALLASYYRHAWNGQGQRPSGADLVGQLCGGLSFFDKNQNHEQVSLDWPFADKLLSFFHTGNKVATHEHLRTLSDFDESEMLLALKSLQKGLAYKSWAEVVVAIKAYRQALASLGFTCPETLALLRSLDQIPQIDAAKGCGALGADVIVILTDKKNSELVLAQAQKLGLTLLATSDSLATGLEMKGSL